MTLYLLSMNDGVYDIGWYVPAKLFFSKENAKTTARALMEEHFPGSIGYRWIRSGKNTIALRSQYGDRWFDVTTIETEDEPTA